MLGPVFSLELRLAARRGRLNTFRTIYSGWWILQFAVLFLMLAQSETDGTPPRAGLGPFFNVTFQIFVAQHFIFLLLATPAFVAGAITDEKSANTLQHLLIADLATWEIVIGKFLGRMAQVVLLALVGWPLVCFLGGYGHLGWPALLAIALITGLLLFAQGAASVWASVRSKQTREAVLRVYAWTAMAFLLVWGGLEGIQSVSWRYKPGSPVQQRLLQVEGVLRSLDPLSALDAVWNENDLQEFFGRLQILLLVYGGIGVICLALAIGQFRSMYIRQVEAAGRARKSRWRRRRREVDDDPVRWREATTGARLPRWLTAGLLAALTCGSSGAILYSQEPTLFIFQGVVFLFLASLVAGVRASGAVTGERERQTWDSLLITPLDTWDLIMDKANGALDTLMPYFVAFAVPATLLAFWTGTSALVFTVSLLLLTWAALYYMAATGIWCSVRSKSSWRSLVATLTTGYGYLLGLLFLFAVAAFWFSCSIGSLMFFFLAMIGLTNVSFAIWVLLCIPICLGMSWFLWKASFPKLDKARAWVDEHERYGRTFVRSLASALRKHYQRREEQGRRDNKGEHPQVSVRPADAT